MEETTYGVDAFAQNDYLEHVNYINPPVSLVPRVLKYIEEEWPTAKCIFIMPFWTAQPWFKNLCCMCNAVYKLPLKGIFLFEKVHDFPVQHFIKNNEWEYVVGFRNMPIKNPPNLSVISAVQEIEY